MIFVGTRKYSYGRMKMFHIATDEDIDKLHNFIDKLGINRKYFQNHPKHPHYDICQTKKQLAIQLGAIEVCDKILIKNCFQKCI